MARRNDAPASARRTLLGTSLGNVIVILDVTVVNVAIDSIRTQLHASLAELQWVVSAYTLVFAALLLSGGALSDRHGPRRTFAAGLAVFTLASAGCGLAGGVTMLIAARALQGVGAAICVPASLALLADAFPDGAARARAISIWGGIGGLSLAAGPIVGGALIAYAGWPSVFFLNVPVGLAAIWLTRGRQGSEAGRPDRGGERGLDLPGQLAVVPVLAGVTYACIQSGTDGWRSPWVIGGLAVSAVALPVFLAVERAGRHPMLPLGLFRSAAADAGFLAGFAMNFSYYGVLFALSLFFQAVRGYSPLLTGLTFLPMTVLAVAVNLGSGSLIARVGPKVPLVSGFALAIVGYLALMWMSDGTPYALIVGPMLAIGVGSALSLPAFTVMVMEEVAPERRGAASGVLNACRQAGGVLGVGVFGSLVAGPSFTAGLHAAVLVCAALLFAALAAAALFAGQAREQAGSTRLREAQEDVGDIAVADWPEA